MRGCKVAITIHCCCNHHSLLLPFYFALGLFCVFFCPWWWSVPPSFWSVHLMIDRTSVVGLTGSTDVRHVVRWLAVPMYVTLTKCVRHPLLRWRPYSSIILHGLFVRLKPAGDGLGNQDTLLRTPNGRCPSLDPAAFAILSVFQGFALTRTVSARTMAQQGGFLRSDSLWMVVLLDSSDIFAYRKFLFYFYTILVLCFELQISRSSSLLILNQIGFWTLDVCFNPLSLSVAQSRFPLRREMAKVYLQGRYSVTKRFETWSLREY